MHGVYSVHSERSECIEYKIASDGRVSVLSIKLQAAVDGERRGERRGERACLPCRGCS